MLNGTTDLVWERRSSLLFISTHLIINLFVILYLASSPMCGNRPNPNARIASNAILPNYPHALWVHRGYRSHTQHNRNKFVSSLGDELQILCGNSLSLSLSLSLSAACDLHFHVRLKIENEIRSLNRLNFRIFTLIPQPVKFIHRFCPQLTQ